MNPISIATNGAEIIGGLASGDMSSVWKGVKNLGLSWLGGEVVKKGKEFLGNHNTSTTTSDITSSTDVDVDTSDSIFDASDYFRCFLW